MEYALFRRTAVIIESTRPDLAISNGFLLSRAAISNGFAPGR